MGQARLDQALAELANTVTADTAMAASLVLYGSAARGDWDASRSDVNLLLVVNDASPDALRRLTPAVAKWHQAGFTPPLIIGREEWHAASDVFPVEITDMRLSHRMIAGPDPLVDLTVNPDELRRALEVALRGKSVRLRQAWVRFGDQAPVLGGFAAASISELLVLMRCIAQWLGRDPGATPTATITALAPELGDGAATISEFTQHRRDKEWSVSPVQFASYLDAISQLINLVDNPQRGVN
jgi:hypothetical protein